MVLDTNILIAYLDDDKKVVEAVNTWFVNNLTLFISIVSYVEILSLSEASQADLVKIRKFLANFILIDVNKELGELTATVKREYKFKFPDAAIVATAKFLSVSLVTRDKALHRARGIKVVKI